jgi:hypothetical protein
VIDDPIIQVNQLPELGFFDFRDDTTDYYGVPVDVEWEDCIAPGI